MSNLWHISDIHLSFLADGSVQKDMSQRNWSKGSGNYKGYLDKMSAFGLSKIAHDDFVVVTGDIVHDMKQVVHSLRWMRQNTNGILIFIKGNHDKHVDFAALRLDYIGERVFFIDEGEIVTIGPYTFGCISDHVNKESITNVNDWLSMAYNVVAQAKKRDTKPVMLSHYPVTEDTAKDIGEIGVKIYLSGHIHCTNGAAPDGSGNDWEWYDKLAKPTDNKVINGCFFSTGTTDVNYQKLGEYYKEIKAGKVSPLKGNISLRNKAGAALQCHDKLVDKFEVEDPFNLGNTLAGFISRAQNTMNGSLYITHVNGVETESQLIYGTPKLQYPYEGNTTNYIDLKKISSNYVLNDKWNGMNVLFYKYYDSNGNMYITAKSKGTAVLKNSDHGQFLTLTKEALGYTGKANLLSNLPDKLMPLMYDSYQGLSMELCGRKEPHLVKYDFDIDLIPLFFSREDGRIEPATKKLVGKSDEAAGVCAAFQLVDNHINVAYRHAHNLPHKYEYEHFATEGRVLYMVDENGICINRALYKIKPKDVEEVHWQSFDLNMQGRVREAIAKLNRDNLPIDELHVRQELDMGPKEWDKFGSHVMTFVTQSPAEDKRQVLVLVGLPGSGKSVLAKELESLGYVRVNQDELGSRNKCKDTMETALRNNKNVVVDRCNFDRRQRAAWIDLAAKYGVRDVHAIRVTTDINTCKDRVVNRQDHPTVAPIEASKNIVDSFAKIFVEPSADEGFVSILQTSDTPSVAEIKDVIRT